MAKKIYACTGCSQTFSRKYNAERHNEKIHNQMANIYDKQTRWKTESTKRDDASQAQQSSFQSLSSFNTTTTSSTLSDIESKNKDNKNLNSKCFVA